MFVGSFQTKNKKKDVKYI